MTDVEKRVLAVINAELGLRMHAPTLDDTFDELGIGPLDRVCICCQLEEELGIEIPDATMEGWASVADVVAAVDAKIGSKVTAA